MIQSVMLAFRSSFVFWIILLLLGVFRDVDRASAILRTFKISCEAIDMNLYPFSFLRSVIAYEVLLLM